MQFLYSCGVLRPQRKSMRRYALLFRGRSCQNPETASAKMDKLNALILLLSRGLSKRVLIPERQRQRHFLYPRQITNSPGIR